MSHENGWYFQFMQRLTSTYLLLTGLGLGLSACNVGGASLGEIPEGPVVIIGDPVSPSACSGGLRNLAESADDTDTYSINKYVAQSFVLSQTDTLSRIEIHLNNSATGAVFTLNADNGAGSPNLASPLYSSSIPANGDAWYTFSTSVALNSGTTYYLVIDESAVSSGSISVKMGASESVFSGGLSIRSSNGTHWNSSPVSGDLAFRLRANCS